METPYTKALEAFLSSEAAKMMPRDYAVTAFNVGWDGGRLCMDARRRSIRVALREYCEKANLRMGRKDGGGD